MRGRRRIWAAALLLGLAAVPAFASGGAEPSPRYIDHHGGTPAELGERYRGRVGVVMAGSHAPMLYLQWRLLHGLAVGGEAGAALSEPCCNIPWQPTGVEAWLQERSRVLGAPDTLYFIPTDRAGANYSTLPNCFHEAFETAAATLRDRAARHGRTAPEVRAWLLTQDAVFNACARPAAALPPAPTIAPAWLRADRAYQEAAFALYNRRSAEAAERFAAIAGDPDSPWRPMGVYLGVRALLREALANPSPASFAIARRVLAALAATPEGTYGRGEVRKMLRALAYRDRPAELLAELDRELGRREPAADIAVGLRDYLGLAQRAERRPDAADWILTLQSSDRAEALGHARARWSESRDPAWLIAALSLASPGDAAAGALADDAARIGAHEAAWPTARYHLVRLTMASADPAATRARLDAALARSDLTRSERNLFAAARAQVATDLTDFARFALRRPYCSSTSAAYCVEDGWARPDRTLARLGGAGEWTGLGADARAIVDRLPLAERIALSRDSTLPAPLRMDIALTSFPRALQLHDEAAIAGLARDLALLLPQMRSDWRAVAAQRPGPGRRFAAYFAIAKIPGLRPDLAGYIRPRGTVRQFEGYWMDWMILPRGRTAGAVEAPAPSSYRWDDWYGSGDSEDDLTCLGQCGPGASPLHLPAFVAERQDRAAAERAAFVTHRTGPEGAPRPFPAGTLSAWEELLAFARAHPRDPRSPEALYRLIRIARWGANHDHIGRRAFQLLHRRYPGSVWARRSPYYYD